MVGRTTPRMEPEIPVGCPECGDDAVENLPRSVSGRDGDSYVCTSCNHSW